MASFCRHDFNLLKIFMFLNKRKVQRRPYSTKSFSVSYSEYGDPTKVLTMVEKTLTGDIGNDNVLVEMLASPINPSDINMIQGVYPIKPQLPAVGGNEGVGRVLKAGSSVKNIYEGDLVMPVSSGWGTWKTHALCKAEEFNKLDRDIDIISAATLSVNPCTAYRMIHDFKTLQRGDTIIQNGANSGVGQAVIQIAAALGINTVNIIRKREPSNQAQASSEDVSDYLKRLGATYVVNEEFVRTPEMKQIYKEIPRPKLAFNCVGGKSVTELLRQLENKGTMVTYGGMSKQPVVIPTGSLIFNDITVRGYWMTRWRTENINKQENKDMITFLCTLIKDGTLQPPKYEVNKLSNFKEAVSKAMKPFSTTKQILLMDASE